MKALVEWYLCPKERSKIELKPKQNGVRNRTQNRILQFTEDLRKEHRIKYGKEYRKEKGTEYMT